MELKSNVFCRKHIELYLTVRLVRLVTPGAISYMVEYVVLTVLLAQRRFIEYQALQRWRQWQYLTVPEVRSFRVGILGLVAFGSTVVQKLAAFGFLVRG